MDVAANSAAVRCQNAYGRPIMASLHAAYSLGALGAAALAAATAATSRSVLFLATGLALTAGVLAAGPLTFALDGTDQPPAASGGRSGVLPRRRLWLLGALAASSLLGEGRQPTGRPCTSTVLAAPRPPRRMRSPSTARA